MAFIEPMHRKKTILLTYLLQNTVNTNEYQNCKTGDVMLFREIKFLFLNS